MLIVSVYLTLSKKHNILSLIINVTFAATAPAQLHTCHSFCRLCQCLSATVSQEKTPSLRGVRQHLTGNNISAHGRRLLSYIHASEFGVRRFPSARKPNAAAAVRCWPLKPNRPDPKRYLPRSFTNDAPVAGKCCQQQLCSPQ